MNTPKDLTLDLVKACTQDIKNGGAISGFNLAHMLLGEGPKIEPEILVEIVEGILELAVLAGSPLASQCLDDNWELAKRIHIKRLVRKT